jgi:TolB-like protein/DNA-binding winged helix-turn-helix (wHTH) protein
VSPVIHIGEWQVFPDLDRLRGGDGDVALAPKEMDLLIYLAGHCGEVVSVDQIIEHVWQGAHLGDDTVYVTVSHLRRALGDNARVPTYIETIPKRGYRLIADVRGETGTRGIRRLPALLIAAGLMSLALFFFLYGGFMPDKASVQPPKSIAVLPFVNLSNDPDQEYLADGISEEILNSLTQYPDLRVAARTSSFQFKGEKRGIPDIGQQLNVAHVLEGSLRKDGESIRITVQLVSVEDGYHLWSRTYDRRLENIFTVQNEIATAIASTLGLTLNTTRGADSLQSTSSLQAYENYLRAAHLLRFSNPENVDAAIELLKVATEQDPDYAAAHAFLGQVYLFSGVPGARDRSTASLLRALEINPDNALALVMLGYIRLLRDWDWDAADDLMQRAYAAAPSSSEVLHWYSIHLSVTGRLADSLAIEKKAASLDPLNMAARGSVGQRHIYLRQFEEARDVYLNVQEKFPESQIFDIRLADVYRYMGDLDRSQRVLDNLAIEPGSTGDIRYRFLMAFARGERATAREIMGNEMSASVEAGRYPFHWYADALAQMGDLDEAVTWFGRSVDRRNRSFLRYMLYPLPEGLVEHPGWQALWRTPPLDGLRTRHLEAGEISWQQTANRNP